MADRGDRYAKRTDSYFQYMAWAWPKTYRPSLAEARRHTVMQSPSNCRARFEGDSPVMHREERMKRNRVIHG